MSRLYRYEPLSNAEKYIRIAILQPGQYEDEIVLSFYISMFIKEMADTEVGQTKPFNYEALSYAWGRGEKESAILVKKYGQPRGRITIKQNLDVALRHLRSISGPRSIWIDAICINQSDDVEKGMQVAMMGKIFSHASRVIAWIGPEKDRSNEALDMMQHWANQINVNWGITCMRPGARSTERHWADRDSSVPYMHGQLQLVRWLLQRPYFERLWVRQEVTLASSALLQCGRKHITWLQFRKAVFCLRMKNFHADDAESGAAYQLVRNKAFELCATLPCTAHLATMRCIFRHTKCHDERDNLFAVLDLLCPRDQALRIKPDYTRTAKDLFVDTARRYIGEMSNLDLLETCEISSRSLDIPSWVPDWSSRISLESPVYAYWSACGWISAQATFLEQDRLRVSGINISQVEHVVEYEHHDDLYSLRHGVNAGILRQLRSMKQLDQNGKEEEFLRACCDILMCDYTAECSLPLREDLESYAECERLLELILSSDKSFEELSNGAKKVTNNGFRQLSRILVGRCFVQMCNKSIGLAPADTKVGDIVAVLLGGRAPMILRPLSGSDSEQTWQVVGPCAVSGLMHGEAIYRNKLSDHWRFVIIVGIKREDIINGDYYNLYDPKTGVIRSNPAEILEEVGIKVESYQREPHRLIVLPETLRAAGIPLQDFTLV